MPILEVCTGSLQSVINAVTGGAKRIELCSALSLDGLTPSLGLIKIVRKMFPELTIHTLIRPREGDFFYNEAQSLGKVYHSVGSSSSLPFLNAL